MTDAIDRRLTKLEARAGAAAEPIEVILVHAGESARDVWARDHPGEVYPPNSFVVRFITPLPDGPHGR
jgi:hypothetical protein